MLTEQIRHEFGASHHYLAGAIWFHNQGLDKWGAFFRAQSDEERGHGMKIVDFLVDCGVAVQLPEVESVSPNYGSAGEILKASLAAEQSVTKSFHEMCRKALEVGDYTSFEFLQWFVKEQVEEEALLGGLIQMVESGVNLFVAETLLPAREE